MSKPNLKSGRDRLVVVSLPHTNDDGCWPIDNHNGSLALRWPSSWSEILKA